MRPDNIPLKLLFPRGKNHDFLSHRLESLKFLHILLQTNLHKNFIIPAM